MSTYLIHAGVLGMKWGIRRYQNKDGTLTPEGKLRYGKNGEGYEYKSKLTARKERKAEEARAKGNTKRADRYEKEAEYNRTIDKRMQEYAKSVSVGGNIAARWLTGGVVGGKAYQTALATLDGQDRVSTGKKALAALIASASYGAGGSFGDVLIREAMSKVS